MKLSEFMLKASEIDISNKIESDPHIIANSIIKSSDQ